MSSQPVPEESVEGCSHEFDALDGLRLRCSKCGLEQALDTLENSDG
jgi:hypothetical protein